MRNVDVVEVVVREQELGGLRGSIRPGFEIRFVGL